MNERVPQPNEVKPAMQSNTIPIKSHELTSSPDQIAAMDEDTARVLRYKARLDAWTGGKLDAQRMLGVGSATHGAERYLPFTVPLMLRQAQHADYWCDLFLGFNSGFTSPTTLAALKAMPDTAVIELYAPTRIAPGTPAQIWDNPAFEGPPILLEAPATPAQHRVFIVYQQAGEHSRGKVRMLGDIFLSLLLPSVEAGWTPPASTLLFDAESIFVTNQEHARLDSEMEKIRLLQRKIPDDLDRQVHILMQAYGRGGATEPAGLYPADSSFTLDSPGLGVFLQAFAADPTLDIIGAITKFCVYEPQPELDNLLLPNFMVPVSTLHQWCNYTWGSVASMRCMPGGGTLGRTLVIMALMAAMTDTFVNLRGEDALLTVLARPAGFNETLCGTVYVTNRCPGLDEVTAHSPPRPAWLQQFVRWYSAVVAVDLRYGANYTKDVIGPEDGYLVSILAIFAQELRGTGDSEASLNLLQSFLGCKESYMMMLQYAFHESLSLFGDENVAAW